MIPFGFMDFSRGDDDYDHAPLFGKDGLFSFLVLFCGLTLASVVLCGIGASIGEGIGLKIRRDTGEETGRYIGVWIGTVVNFVIFCCVFSGDREAALKIILTAVASVIGGRIVLREKGEWDTLNEDKQS